MQKSQEQSSRSRYEKDRIAHAKRIMKPFFLRRLKSEVGARRRGRGRKLVRPFESMKYTYVFLLSLFRLVTQVLTELPTKTEVVVRVPMSQAQYDLYCRLVSDYKERAKAIAAGAPRDPSESGVGLLMNLRKAAQHPLLIRNHYDDEEVKKCCFESPS